MNQTSSAPVVSQVAVIWKDNEDTLDLREYDILVQKHDGYSERIKYYYRCYDSLQYPMLFPFGEPGWHQDIERVNRSNRPPNKGQQRPVIPHNCSTVEELLNVEPSGKIKYLQINLLFQSISPYACLSFLCF